MHSNKRHASAIAIRILITAELGTVCSRDAEAFGVPTMEFAL